MEIDLALMNIVTSTTTDITVVYWTTRVTAHRIDKQGRDEAIY